MKPKTIALSIALAAFAALSIFAGTADLPTFSGGILTTGTAAPSNGTNEIQTITIGLTGGPATGGSFRISFDGFTTGTIALNGTAATMASNIDTALEALSNIGTGGVTTAATTYTSGTGSLTVTFTGDNAHLDVSAMTYSNSLTGTGSPSLSGTTTTAGVTADGRNSLSGTPLIGLTGSGSLFYINRGIALSPTWTAVGPP